MRVVVFACQQAVQISRVWPQVRARTVVGLRHFVTPYAAD
jgi:hypothetical protein